MIDHDNLGERIFNAEETLSQIHAVVGSMVVASWGLHGIVFHNVRGGQKWMRFRVNGHHHKGYVYIYLAANDTYTVILATFQDRIVKEFHDVYADMLGTIIDDAVEKIDDHQI